jgi:MFS family permease
MMAETRRSLVLLGSVNFFHSMSTTAAMPIIPLFVKALGGGAGTIGAVVAASEFLPIFIAMHLGSLSDRVGPRVLVLIGAVLLVVCQGVRALADGVFLMIAIQVVTGISTLLVFLCAQNYVARVSRPQDQMTNFSNWALLSSVGQLIGPVVGGMVADAALRQTGDVIMGYRAVFWVTAVMAVGCSVAAVLLPPVSGLSADKINTRRMLREAAALFRVPRISMGTSASFTIILNSGLRRSFLPVYLVALGLSATQIGIVISAYSLSAIGGRVFVGVTTRRWGDALPLAGALSLCALGWGLMPFFRDLPSILALTAISGIGSGFATPVTMAMVALGAPPERQGLALGIRQTSNRLADFLSPPAYGLVVGLAGLASTFYLAAAFALGGLFFLRTPRRRHAEAAAAVRAPAEDAR